MQILGLEVCADTVVGNEMLRGISGGQRKRVTTGMQKYTSRTISSSSSAKHKKNLENTL